MALLTARFRPIFRILTGALVLFSASAAAITPAAAGRSPAAQIPVPRQIAGSVDYLTSTYHVTQADAIRRLDLQSWSSQTEPVLARRFRAEYAGMWLDQAHGGILYIATTRPGLLLRWPGLRAERRWIRAVLVARSRASLTRLQTRMQATVARLGGWTSIDDQRDQVVVWTTSAKLSAMASAIGRLRIAAGAYAVHVAAVMQPAACNLAGRQCDPPMRGGVQLDLWNASMSTILGYCTNGFDVHGSNGWDYTLTAGHCFTETNAYYTRAWDASANSHWVGTLNGGVFIQAYPIEYALLPYYTGAGSNNGNAYWIPAYQPQYEVLSVCKTWTDPYGGSCTTNESWPMKGMYTYSQIGVGWTVCAAGATTGTICGGVTSKDGGIVTNICRKAGDSGGPLFSQADDMAYGILYGSSNADPNVACTASNSSDYSALSVDFADATSKTGLTYTIHTTGGGVTSSQHAVWTSDSYNGSPLTSITLAPGQTSSPIYITFNNQGPGTWDANTVLAAWSGSGDGAPGNGTTFCHAPGSDWKTCDPGVPAWDGTGAVAPGQSVTFEFQIQANSGASTTTLYFRPAERQSDGSYQWINTQNGNRTYDYFTVHVS